MNMYSGFEEPVVYVTQAVAMWIGPHGPVPSAAAGT
jgi:hypothetical protein